MFHVPFSVCLRLILAYIGEGVRLCYEWRVCVCVCVGGVPLELLGKMFDGVVWDCCGTIFRSKGEYGTTPFPSV
jgi:hypothetical protein